MIDTLIPEVSRHKCLIYDGHPSESLPVVVPLLMKGLSDRHRCLYLGDPQMVAMVDSALGRKGVDTGREAARGALILTSDRSHLEGGRFEPETMVRMLTGLVDQAVRDGFSGLCATGDMSWEFGDEKNFERLLEYEALLDRIFREKPLIGICQYRRDAVPGHAVEDALRTHRSVYHGSELNRDNLFYIPPELLLDEASDARRSERQGAWMCQQITRVLSAEEKRDQALAALKKSEEEQRRLAETLAQLNRDLERRVQERTRELEESNRDLESFSYSVSHDLRTPLRAISGYARILQEENSAALDDEGKRRLASVLGGARRMGELIDKLLEFSRIGRAAMHEEEVDTTGLAREVVADLLPAGSTGKVSIELGMLPPARADRTLLRQVFTNLLSNALKYSRKREQPRVEIGARAVDGELHYWVRDNGAGFEQRFADKLFGMFQRLHSQKEFEGTGVGLALVKRIIERHRGRVWAEGKPGEGATFFFSLPG